MSELRLNPDQPASKLVGELRNLGFTPETHPDLAKDMARRFRETVAAGGYSLEDQISVTFEFDTNGLTGVKIKKRD